MPKICTCGKKLSKQKEQQVAKHYMDNWEVIFDLFHKGDPNLGSAGWRASPNQVKNFIRSLLI